MREKISIVLDGTEYDGFTSISVTQSFLSICRGFQATVSVDNTFNEQYPIKLNQQCIIKVNNQKVLTGYVEKLSTHQDTQTRHIRIQGRDLLADLIDSTIDGSVIQPFTGSIYFDDLCRQVITKLGLSVETILDASDRPVFSKDDFITPDTGMSFYSYLDKYAAKVQLYLNSDELGNLLIRRSDNANTVNNFLSLQINNSQNNILSSESHYDTTTLFNQYRCHSQQQQLNAFTSLIKTPKDYEDQITAVIGVATNPNIRRSRIYNFIANASMNRQTAQNRAIWSSNYHNSRYMCYRCKIEGYTYNGNDLWKPNLRVPIIDEIASINATLLTAAVTFNFSVDEISTELHFVLPDSFSLQAERNDQSKSSQKVGDIYDATQ